MEKRIVIGGCRNYNDYTLFSEYVKSCLSEFISDNVTIISGHCSGVDCMAERYAKENGLKCLVYPADWGKYGRAAGPIRNKALVENSDAIIAFWDGKSKGTKNLIDIAARQSKRIWVCHI